MTTQSFLKGAVFGAATAIGAAGAARAFGSAHDAEVALAIETFAAFAAGLLAPQERAVSGQRFQLPAAPPLRIAAGALAVLALLISWGASPLGHAVAWAGGGLEAGPIALGFARALVAAPFLLPGAWLLGTISRTRREPPTSPRAGAAPISGAFLGILAVAFAVELPHGLELAGSVVALSFVALARLTPARLSPGSAAPTSTSAVLSGDASLAGPLLAAFAIGFAARVTSSLAPRLLSFAAGNDLGGIPVAAFLFLAGIAGGALVAVAIAAVLPFRPTRTASIALLGASLVMLCFWSRFDELVPRFVEWAASPISFSQFVANASRVVAPLVMSVGALLGFAAATLAREVREDDAARVRTAAGAFLGFLAGQIVFARALGAGRLEGAIDATGISLGLLAALGIAFSGGGALLRFIPALVAAGAVFFAVRMTPPVDRDALLVERGLMPAGSLIERAQKNWLVFDEDGAFASSAVVRRGHARRILVNGRFEASNESVKTHGLLAHLPLLLHPSPRAVLVIGSGNGLALAATLSHSVERVECLETDRVFVRTTALCGMETERAMKDERLAFRIGDPTDLLARSGIVDVIVSQASGAWTERSFRVSTREFFELAARRLGPEGLLCQWIPDSSLSKEGIRILLATCAEVFPDVQAWSGQGGDLLILARKSKAPIDAPALLDRFRACPCEASLAASWVVDPVTFLSNFLVSDATVRRLSANAPIHERERPRLGREEAARRRSTEPVNPVPGLADLNDDVANILGGAPVPGLGEAARLGAAVRGLEREAGQFQAERRTFEAIDAYQRAIEINPRDGSVRRSLAMMRTRLGIQYVQDNSILAGHNNLRAAIEADSTYAQGFANLGGLLVDLGPPEYALATTHQAIVLEPDDDLSWAQLGEIRRRQAVFDEAARYFEKALELNPRNLVAATGYVDTKMEMDAQPDFAWAVGYLETFLADEPGNEDLLYRIGKLRDAMRQRRGVTPVDEATSPPVAAESTSAR